MKRVATSLHGVLPIVVIAIIVSTLVSSFNSAEAIVSGHSTAHIHYLEYPYNLLIPFFTIICSTLLAMVFLHYYRTQWGKKSVITE